MDLSVKYKTIKLLDDNIGKTDDFRYGDNFLDTSNSRSMKGIIEVALH